jgi:Uma2 family endonuclease
MLYASFGVRELWVVDAAKLRARVFRAPAAQGYGEAHDFAAADRLIPAFAPEAFALSLDELALA